MKKKTIASFVMIFVIALLATSCSNNNNIVPIDKGEVKETEKEIGRASCRERVFE